MAGEHLNKKFKQFCFQIRYEIEQEMRPKECHSLQAKVGREKEFQDALRKLRGKDADITFEAAEIKVLLFLTPI